MPETSTDRPVLNITCPYCDGPVMLQLLFGQDEAFVPATIVCASLSPCEGAWHANGTALADAEGKPVPASS